MRTIILIMTSAAIHVYCLASVIECPDIVGETSTFLFAWAIFLDLRNRT